MNEKSTPTGKKIKIALIENDMTQAQLSDILSIDQNSIGMAIRGYRTGKRYQAILQQAEDYLKSLTDENI